MFMHEKEPSYNDLKDGKWPENTEDLDYFYPNDVLVQWWIPCLAVVFAIAVVKLPFGDSRSLMFLPSAGGIAFVTICFPEEIFAYPVIPQPVDSLAVFGSENFIQGDSIAYMLSQGNSIGVNIVNYIDIAVGNVPGPMGTTCAVAMLGGLIYMLFRRPKGAVVSVSFLTACALFAAVFPRVGTSRTISVIMELSGGLRAVLHQMGAGDQLIYAVADVGKAQHTDFVHVLFGHVRAKIIHNCFL